MIIAIITTQPTILKKPYGSYRVIDMAIQFASNAENKIDACVDLTPSLIIQIKK
jgi:hypothetical protein